MAVASGRDVNECAVSDSLKKASESNCDRCDIAFKTVSRNTYLQRRDFNSVRSQLLHMSLMGGGAFVFVLLTTPSDNA